MDVARRPFGRIKLFTFFLYGSTGLFMPFLPLYFEHLGFDPIQIGLLVSLGPVMAIIANPFWGYISDRLQNMKLILLVLLAGNLVTSQIVFQFRLFGAVFASILAYYFFQSALSSMNNTMIFQSIQSTNHKFGAFRMWGSLGFAAVALTAGPVIQWMGIARIGVSYGLFIIATMLLAFLLTSQKKKKKSSQPVQTNTLELFKNVPFVMFLGMSLIIFIPNSINNVYLTLYLKSLGGSEVSVGWSWFLAAILEVPLFILLDRYMPRSKVIMTGALVITAALFAGRWFLMGIVSQPIHLLLIQLLHSVTFGTYLYIAAQMCEFMVVPQLRASGQAMYALVQGALATCIAGVIGGFVYETLGPSLMYMSGGILTLIGLAGMVLLRRMLIQMPEGAESL
jgi:MFS transporter, PPP family, 3-phenylpropionic acid transporter